MSRIGKMPVGIPAGVKVSKKGNLITVVGPRGTLKQEYRPEVEIDIQEKECIINRRNESKLARSMHGLYRQLIANMVTGVSSGFSKVLLINGVGYRAEISGNNLVLNLGYSNPIEYPIPEGIEIKVEGNTRLIVGGYDKQKLGQVCAEVRSFRPPEPYKGKGIRYENEYVRRKIGKSAIK
jgi:large subunit ribosomal protein L6